VPQQQQQTGVRGLVAAVKIHCEFLTPDRWQIEGKQCTSVMAAVALR
jgi:hypothetical protein